MTWRAYPTYRAAGVAWLPQLPRDWDLLNLRWVSRRYAGGTPDKGNSAFWDDGNIPWLNSGAVNEACITEPSAYITREGYEGSSAKWVPKGALVIALAGQGKTKGMVAQLVIDTTCNQSMAAVVPTTRVRSRYLFWWLTANYNNLRNMAGGEARDGLNLDLLGGVPCPIPSQDEQRAIADFLDRETAKIDTLVAKKRTLIERLKEKRSALISRSVTKGLPPDAARAAGLDPHPKLKPSGIEWLGDVPEHWAVRKLGHISNVVRGASPRPAGDSRYFDGDFVPWITVGDLTKDSEVYLTSTDSMLTVDGAALSRTIRRGTLVITNSGATLGVPKILSVTGCANDGVVAFQKLRSDANVVFLYYFLASITNDLRDRIKQGSGQPNLNTEIIRGLAAPTPPPLEQGVISDFLGRETAKIDSMVAKIETAIARLHEYRTALITAAVTGKIDVRAASSQPQQEPAPLSATA